MARGSSENAVAAAGIKQRLSQKLALRIRHSFIVGENNGGVAMAGERRRKFEGAGDLVEPELPLALGGEEFHG